MNEARYLRRHAPEAGPGAIETAAADRFYGRSGLPGPEAAPGTSADLSSAALTFARHDPDARVRSAAVVALAKTGGDAAFAAIHAALEDQELQVREAACLALGISGRPEAVPSLLEILDEGPAPGARSLRERDDPASRLRCRAILALGLIGSRSDLSGDGRAGPRLVEFLEQDPEIVGREVITSAIIALGLMRATESVPALMAYVADPDHPARERAQAVTALGRIGDAAAKPLVAAALRDKQGVVVRSAAQALGQLLHEDDVDWLPALRMTARSGRDLPARNQAILSLGHIGSIDGRNFLASILRSGTSSDRSFAALALGIHLHRRPDDPSRAAIAEDLLDGFRALKNPEERGAFAVALALVGHDPAGAPILAMLREKVPASLRAHLCAALGILGHREATTVLRHLVRPTESAELRRQAAIALGLLGASDAEDDLKAAFRSPAGPSGHEVPLLASLRYEADPDLVRVLGDTLFNRAGTQPEQRALAAVALGIAGERGKVPALLPLFEQADPLLATATLAELRAHP